MLIPTSAVAPFPGTVIFISLLVIIALTAIPYGTVEPWWQAIFQCAIFGLAMLWAADGLLSGQWFVKQHRLLVPMLAIFVFVLIQMALPLRRVFGGITSDRELRPLSFSPNDTRMIAFQLLALIIAGGLLLRYTTNRRRLTALVYVVVGIGLGSAIFGFLRLTFQHQPGFLLPRLQPDDGTLLRGVGFAQFINHNHFAFLAEMSLGLVLGLMLRRPVRLKRLCAGLALAVPMWVAVVYSGTRGGLVSITGQVLVVSLVIFIFRPGREFLNQEERHTRGHRFGPFLVTRLVVIASVLVVMMLAILWVGGDPLASHLESVSNEFGVKESDKYTRTYRSTIWPMTWRMIKDHSIAGVGFGGYWIAVPRYHRGSGEMTPQQAHNDYLELLASGGLIGCALAIWFVAGFLSRARTCLRSSDPDRRSVCFGALAGIFGVAVHSFVDFGLHLTVNALVFVTLIVIATTSVRPQEAPVGSRPLKREHFGNGSMNAADERLGLAQSEF
jgi:putative inorganic carbon (HCO3(-)) transporter